MTVLYHFTTMDRGREGRMLNKSGEPFTVGSEGLKRSRSHLVCMTPDPEEASSYAMAARNRTGIAKIYFIDSEKVPEVTSSGKVWRAEYVPNDAIVHSAELHFNHLMTPREIQWRMVRAAKRAGWT